MSHDSTDTLLHYTGLSDIGVDAVDVWFSEVYGNDTEFTKDFGVTHHYQFGGQTDGVGYAYGNFVPVLFGAEVSFGQSDVLAWIPQDKSIRAVVHSPIPVPEYYSQFIHLVLCNYFGLCAPDGVEVSPAPTTTGLQVIIHDERTSLRFASEEVASVDVMNSIGITVFASSLGQSKPEIELPVTLPSGVYFSRVRSGAGMQVKAFAIVQK